MRFFKFLRNASAAVFIMALIISLMLILKPFSAGEAEGKNSQPMEEREEQIDILDEDSIDNDELPEEPSNAEEEMVGYSEGASGEKDSYGIEGSGKGNEYFLTYEEIVAVENASLSDKLFGLSVLRKVNKNALERMLRIADGGITYVEWQELNFIMEQYLEEKDIQRIQGIFAKGKIQR